MSTDQTEVNDAKMSPDVSALFDDIQLMGSIVERFLNSTPEMLDKERLRNVLEQARELRHDMGMSLVPQAIIDARAAVAAMGPAQEQLAIKMNQIAGYQECTLCGRYTWTPAGLGLFAADAWDAVCWCCGYTHAPAIMDALSKSFRSNSLESPTETPAEPDYAPPS